MQVETLHTRYGPMQVPGGNDLISRFLREFGEWAWFEADFVGGFIQKGARVLDGGAYIGSFTLGLRDCQPLRVVAVEANPAVLGLLQHNLATLAASWAVVEHGRLGDGLLPSGMPQPTHADNLGSMRFAPVTEGTEGTEVTEVTEGTEGTDGTDGTGVDSNDAPINALSITLLRQRHGPFDLIKLDVEGSELAALQADEDWLRASLPTLWLECNEDPAVLPLHNFVAGLGYELHYFTFPSFNPENHLGNPKPIFALAYEAGLLAVRPGTAVELPEALAKAGCDLARVKDSAHLLECLWLTPRWGLEEWVSMSRPQLLALCSRLHRGQSFAGFLGPG